MLWKGIRADRWLRYLPRVTLRGFQILANSFPLRREAKTLFYRCLPRCFTCWRKTTPWQVQKASCSGIDPNAKKQAEVKELKAKHDNARSFRFVAKAWFTTKVYHQKKWSKDHQNTVWTRLDTYIFPDIGDKDVTELDTGNLLIPIKKVEALGYLEVVTRVKQYVTSILRYTVQQQLIRYNPAYDLEDSIQKPETEHRPALELEEIPLLIERINAYRTY